ncbi:MAG: hypothetical protein LC796_14720 [Acidobacteria bacterium]|nr:hypothetical protein [Acidobacteriota bacterium]MCA1609548.1 hypothetical protein [Acidobacteriota bacterium]
MMRMKALALSASLLVVAAVGCSQYNSGAPVRVTRSSADVSSCQKVTDVDAGRRVADREVVGEIANQARDRGADTVLLAEGARTGAAYRCASPNVASR